MVRWRCRKQFHLMKQKLLFYGTVVVVVMAAFALVSRFLPSVKALVFNEKAA